MNINQAKTIDLRDFLSRIGCHPVGRDSNGEKYYSPLPNRKKDTKPSFYVRKGDKWAWVWHDFGTGEGNTIVDLVVKLKGVDKAGALKELDKHYPEFTNKRKSKSKPQSETRNLFSSSFQSPPQASAQNYEIRKSEPRNKLISALPLQSKTILDYLSSRNIPKYLAQKYLRLIKYRNPKGQEYYGFGIQNESDGWDVRSASNTSKFKTVVGPKDITIIRGREEGRGEVSIFEGQLDFLSLLTMFRAKSLKGDAIILHGIELSKKAATYISEKGYTRINTFLDNDKGGQEKTGNFINGFFNDEGTLLISGFGELVMNYSPRFLPYEDLNKSLQENHFPDFSPKPPPPHP